MSKEFKKELKHKKRRDVLLTDFTLHDYSDTGRFKKAHINAFHKEAKQLQSIPTLVQDVVETWFDKDREEFDTDTLPSTTEGDDDEEEKEKKEGTASDKNISRKSKNLRRTKLRHTIPDDSGFVYPADIWHILSLYIHPEDVCTFASICKYANTAIHTVSFWRHLYNRHCYDLNLLPRNLMPFNLECVHGLRARVIRSLHYTYPPLLNKTIKFSVDNIPNHLEGQRCILFWQTQMPDNQTWNFYFKFKKDSSLSSRLNHSTKRNDLLNGYNDMFHNPENDCTVLLIICKNYTFVPVVMGYVLKKLSVSVSSSLCAHRMKLSFHSHLFSNSNCRGGSGEELITLDPVISWQCMAWWHRNYPSV
ncbi:transmembrane protein 183-like [Argonauta hians]